MSNQLQGRLELVMGHLLKELKTKFSEVEAYRDTIQSPLAQRTVKQILRDRIKELMMNKYIGGINDGLTVYRKRYPEGTDEALLEEVKQAKEELNVKNPDNKLIQSGSYKLIQTIKMFLIQKHIIMVPYELLYVKIVSVPYLDMTDFYFFQCAQHIGLN